MGGLDVAALLNIEYNNEKHALSLWADKTFKRESQIRKIADLEQQSPEWHAFRKLGVGGSEVSVVVGANPYSSADYVWREKTTETPAQSYENPAMARGKKLEPIARDMYESLMGWSCKPLCAIHDIHDCVRVSLDGLRDDDDLVLEIKAPGFKNHSKMIDLSSIKDPMERQTALAVEFNAYRYQMLYQMLVTGASRCHFVSFNDSNEFNGCDKMAIIEVAAEPNEQQRLLERVLEFWGYVERREPLPSRWSYKAAKPPTELLIKSDTKSEIKTIKSQPEPETELTPFPF